MKNISTVLKESLFDKDLATKSITLKGVSIDDDIWKQCTKFYKGLTFEKLQEYNPAMRDNKVLYSGKDCIIWVYDANGLSDRWLYVLCPETIYMNYMSMMHNIPEEVKGFNILQCIKIHKIHSFVFIEKVNRWGDHEWHPLEGCSSIPSRREGIGDDELCRSYIPETISEKAKNIIKNYK